MTGDQPQWVEPPARLFVSYAGDQTDVARALAKQLVECGYEVWADFLKIGRSDFWWEKTQPHIVSCDVFLALVSPDYFNSEECSRELARARSQECQVVAVVWAEPELWDRRRGQFHAVVPLANDGSLGRFGP